MRSYTLAAILLVAASIAVLPVCAQEEGDDVTFTDSRNDVIYTGVLDPDLDTVSFGAIRTIAVAAATTTALAVEATTAAAVVSEGDLVFQSSPTSPALPPDVVEDETSRLLFIQQRLLKRHFAPAPTSFPLLKRQNQGGAALGGGGGVVSTQTGLQTISGYTPPDVTAAPAPSNAASGTILLASEIPGYAGPQNVDGVSSGSSKVVVTQLAFGLVAGAAVFALL